MVERVIPCRGRVGVRLCMLAVSAAMVSSAGCQHQNTKAAEPAAPAAPVQLPVVTVAAVPWERVVRLQGSLLADERAVVGAKVAGRVKTVRVDLGSIVNAGDVLVALETEEIELRIAQAEAQWEQARARLGLKPGESESALDAAKVPEVLQQAALLAEARSNFARSKTLFDQQAISEEELQQRQAALEVAQARHRTALNAVSEQLALIGVRRAEVLLAQQVRDDAVVKAPFAGMVEERRAAPGQYLQLGQPVATLVRTDPLRFRGGVSEREAMQVRIGQTIRIRVEGRAEPLAARVTRLSPAVEAGNRSLAIEADVPNPRLEIRAGLFAEGEIVVDPDARVLAVPAAAINEFAGVEKVWLVRDGKAAEQPIETGRRGERWVEVRSGLKVGESIAADARQGRAGPVRVVGGAVTP